jgi:hypothetical protein
LWSVVIGAGIELAAQIASGQEIDFTDVATVSDVGAVTGGSAGRAATQAIKGAIGVLQQQIFIEVRSNVDIVNRILLQKSHYFESKY